jgi:hypothetical protein
MVKPPPEAQEKLSPYFVWLNRQNPEPMIRLLERTREFVQAEIKERISQSQFELKED